MAADGPIEAVQEALIRDKFLTGEVSGVHDKATREALQKFQAYHSLPPTGEIDTATLEVLQTSAPTKPAPALALQEPVPKAVVQGDRQFLDGLVTGQEKVPANGESKAAVTTRAVSPATPAPRTSHASQVTPPAQPTAKLQTTATAPQAAPEPQVSVERQATGRLLEAELQAQRRAAMERHDAAVADRQAAAERQAAIERQAAVQWAAAPTPASPVSPVAAGAVVTENDSPAPVKPAKTAPTRKPKSKPRVAQVHEPFTAPMIDADGANTRQVQPVQPGQMQPRAAGASGSGNSGSDVSESVNAPRGKTVRTRTITTGPDGRTYVSETTRTTPATTVEVPQRPKKTGLFDRIHIFHDKDDD
jgi:hypothetical protein